MPLTVIAETGAGVANANSYATRAACDAYHEGRLHGSTWNTASDATKDAALVHSTRFLDANVQWQGGRVAIDQALAWPRKDVVWDGHDVPEDMLPRPVRDATCELARLLIGADLQAEQDSDNVSELNLGQSALVIKFKGDSQTRRVPLAIGELLQGLGGTASGGGIIQRRITR
mgnify:CR=1 FL=1